VALELMRGNEAVAEGAIRAGCKFYTGYPITPQNELFEYMAKRLPQVGGVFLQCESEVAGIVGYLQDDEIGYLLLAEAAGIDLRLAYFDGAAPAITALLGGHVDVLFCTVADNYTQWKAGKIHLLTVMDPKRSKFYPDTPTTVELGYPTVISASTRGIAAPKGLPEPIKKKLLEALEKAAKSKEHIEKQEAAGHPVMIIMGKEFEKYYWESYEVAKKWVKKVRGAIVE